MNKIILEEHPQGKWKQFLVSNISSDTVFICHFTCLGKQHSQSFNIRTYREYLREALSPSTAPMSTTAAATTTLTNCSVTSPGSRHGTHLPWSVGSGSADSPGWTL